MLYVSQLRLQFLARLAGAGAVCKSAVKLLLGTLSQANKQGADAGKSCRAFNQLC